MKRSKDISVRLALAGIMTTSVAYTVGAEANVQCYGIAKAGKNACGSAHPDKKDRHGCSGSAKCDFDGYEWAYAATKEDCEKAGGQLKKFDNPKKVCAGEENKKKPEEKKPKKKSSDNSDY